MKRKKVKCESCGFEISVNCIKNHKDTKTCIANQNGRTIKPSIIVTDDFKCIFCDRESTSKGSFVQHHIRCKLNPEMIVKPLRTEKWYEAMRRGKENGTATNQYLKARRLGLPDPTVSEEVRKKISDASKKREWTEESKKKLSESMLRAVEKNPESYTKNNVCGRVKKIDYNGISLKGSWELKTAQWLDSLNLKWTHEEGPFTYFWEGKNKSYFPDFFLEEHNVYLEVKGYKTERDEAKWCQFPHKLIIVDKDVIHSLESISLNDLIERKEFLKDVVKQYSDEEIIEAIKNSMNAYQVIQQLDLRYSHIQVITDIMEKYNIGFWIESPKEKKIKKVVEKQPKQIKIKLPKVITANSHSEETKSKISESAKGKHEGEKNSQFGKMWIHNLDEKISKSIKVDEFSQFEAEGWLKGRKMKF